MRVFNAIELLVYLIQTYFNFVKKGLVKVNSFTQQIAAMLVLVASMSLVGGWQVIVYVS